MRWLRVALVVGSTSVLAGAPRERRAPPQEVVAHDFGGEFTFTRVRYGAGGGSGLRRGSSAWAHDYPRADEHISKLLSYLTTIRPNLEFTNVFDLDDERLHRYPIAYVSEPGFWSMTDQEADGFRRFLLKGGFAIFDDFENEQWHNFAAQMRRVLPEHDLVELDATHPIFHSFYDLDRIDYQHPLVPVKASYYGIFEDNDRSRRLMVIVAYNSDMAEYWEWSNSDFLPVDLTNEAYKLGVNFIVYGLTH
jgi:hypothetical protein